MPVYIPAVKRSPFSGRKSLSSVQNYEVAQQHRYGCIMLLPSLELQNAILNWSLENIPDFHLGIGGRETNIHVTLKYGFVDSSRETLERVKALLSGIGPITGKLKGFSLFRGNEDGDVLKIDVESAELRKWNKIITEQFPCVEKYPDYRPHITAAYLTPEASQLYLEETPEFLHREVEFTEAYWGGADGYKEQWTLDKILPSQVKDMSWLDSSRGGALVPPPEYRGPKPRRVKSSPFRNRKSLFVSGTTGTKAGKWEGKPCARGVSASRTGCIPAKKPTGGEPQKRGRKPKYSEQEGRQKVGAIYSKIDSMLSGKGEISTDSINEIKEELTRLNLKDIVEIKKKLGVKASGNKKELADKLAERALGKDKINELRQRSERIGSEAIREEDARSGGQMEKPAGGTDHPPGDPGWKNDYQSIGEGTSKRVPKQIEAVNKKLDRFENFFKTKGLHEIAGWMGKLKNHINTVGVESALEQLGPEVEGETEKEEVAYAGARADMPQFAVNYLDRIGISVLPEGGTSDLPVVSSAASSSDEEGWKKAKREDVFPRLQTFKNKLEESQHLPGLERSEDLSKFMGGEMGGEVASFTPEMVEKLDKEFGKDQWIVKSYDDAAYAGFGIFFPQKARQVQKDAQNTLWTAGEQLAKHGFSLHRDEKGKVIGIKHQGGDVYEFGDPVEEETDDGKGRINYPKFSKDGKLFGDVLDWGLKAAGAASSEKGAALPQRWLGTPSRYMVQPAFAAVGISDEERARGMTYKPGQEGRVHITTKNGKAEIVRHATWLKEQPLPVVFENEDTRKMAQAALDAINALPESERQGQMYGPDVMLTRDGYKVVEANPANEAGASGYTQDNPLVMDAYVSQLMEREPAHVRFIRDLLGKKNKQKKPAKKSKSISISPFRGRKGLKSY